MRDLPRSAALAAWGSAVLSGAASIDEAVSVIQGDDLPHEVDLSAVDLDAPVPGLIGLFGALRRAGIGALRVGLPVPGDVAGLPGPAAFNAFAVEAGECVLALEPGSEQRVAFGVVPVVDRRGAPESEHGGPFAADPLDEVVSVVWRALPVTSSAPVPSGPDLRESRQSLMRTLQEATSDLERLDVAAWDDSLPEGLQSVRRRSASAGMPPGTPAPAVAVLDLACRVRAVVRLAAATPTGAVNAFEATRRDATLRILDAASRQAVVAAVNAAADAEIPNGAEEAQPPRTVS